MLDEELARLPTRYRVPLILCCLEGKTRDEAAAQLGWSVGSVKGRLERGREILRSRLAKRGLALSAALAATLLTGAGAQAAVPLTLGLETVRAGMAMLAGPTAGIVSTQVVTLAQGVLHAMFMTKLKIAAAVLIAFSALGLGTGYVTHQVLAGNHRNADATQSYDVLFAAEFPEFTAQREERKAQPSVSGIVQNADATKSTINVLVSRDDAKGQTFDVAKDVKVVIREGREAKDAKFADVKEKTRVVLILDDAKKVVQTIEILVAGPAREGGGERGRVGGEVRSGILTEVDAAKGTITLQTGVRDPNAVQSTTYELAKDFKVIIRTGRSTKEAKLTDLELKKPVQIKLDDAKKKVLTIEVTVSTRAAGAVTEIDAAKGTITLENGGGRGGENAKSETYELAKDVKVFFHLPGLAATGERGRASGKEMKLADVIVKTNVGVQLDDARKIVQVIDVNLPSMRGTLQSVDAKLNTLLIRPARGDDKDLGVAKDATVLINGKAGKLADLVTGMAPSAGNHVAGPDEGAGDPPPPPAGRR